MIDTGITETNVRVFTRIRPLLQKEKINGEESCVKVTQDSKQVIVGKDRGFTFDGVFGPKASQESVYSTAVKELVENIFEGYNSTIFAYGQTGSGKTYTMGTFNQEELLYEEKGIVPRAVEEIFKLISEKDEKIKLTVSASFIEVYKEEVRDLLDPNGSCSGQDVCNIQIREDEKGNTILCGVYEHLCENQLDLIECLDIGSANRVTGATQMNEYSSRSHCVFTVNIVQEWNTEFVDVSKTSGDFSEDGKDNDLKSVISGKFHFVDLAGSERAHKTGNVGDRFKESIHINSGLLALGNVISALGDPKKKKGSHIPYRESKITRILKDSLGGNARTLMICCISPAVSNYDETVNALKYANRARNIRNKPIQNHDKHAKQIVRMQTEIMALREQLSRQKAGTIIQEEAELEDEDHNFVDKTFVHTHQQIKLQHLLLRANEIIGQQVDNLCKGHNETSYDWLTKIENWIELSEEANLGEWGQSFGDHSQSNIDRNFSGEYQLFSEMLRINVNKLKQDLVNDVDIQAHRSSQSKQRDEHIREIEQENGMIHEELDNLRNKLRDYEARLVEQQRELTQYRREIRKLQQLQLLQSQSTTPLPNHQQQLQHQQQYNFSAAPQMSPDKDISSPFDNYTNVSKRIKSSPIPTTNLKEKKSPSSNKLNNLSDPNNHRKIKSSPNILNPEILLSRFHAQSHFLLTEFENDDEVVRPLFKDTFNVQEIAIDDEEKNDKTITKFAKQSSKIFSSQNSREDSRSMLLSSATQRRGSNNMTKMDEVVTATDVYKKQIKISQLKLTDANQKLRDLSINIKLKEQLIKDLVKSTKDTGKINKDYEDKINKLQQEKDETHHELEKLQSKLIDLSSKNKDNESLEVKRIKELMEIIKDYERKMEMGQKKLADLQKRQKETQKLSMLTSNHEKRVNELMITVERLKQEQINMQRKLKLENETKGKLEKDLQRDQERIKQLEIQNEHQQKVLKRKQEEIMAANRKLRRGSNSALSSDNSPKIEDQKKWLDEEIEKVIQYKKQMEELDLDLKKREEILSKKENLLAERSEFCSNNPSKLESIQNNTTNVLTVERDNLKLQKMKLEEKIQSGTILTDKEERWITELDEAIEALDEAIEYKTEIIENKTEALRQSQINVLMSREDIFVRLTQIGPDESRQLLMRYFEKVIDLRERLRKAEAAESERDMQIEELQRLRDQLQRTLERQNLEFDRRYTQLQTNLEAEKQLLLRQIVSNSINSSRNIEYKSMEIENGNGMTSNRNNNEIEQLTEKCNKLEREVYTYKKSSREMKSKIREWVLSGRLKADIDVAELPGQSNIKPTSVVSARPPEKPSAINIQPIQHKSYDPGNYVVTTSVKSSTNSRPSTNSSAVKKSTNKATSSSSRNISSMVTYSSADKPSITPITSAMKITPISRASDQTNQKSDRVPMESVTTSIVDSLDGRI